MSDKKWKSNLLSSSLPLEYEVANVLVKKGFAVEADYTYGRDAESGYGPDFENHCTKMCRVLTDYVDDKRVREVDDVRGVILDRRYRYLGPISFMKGLAVADDLTLQLYFTHFVVCTKDSFPKLVDKLKRWSVQILESRTDMREVVRSKEQSE